MACGYSNCYWSGQAILVALKRTLDARCCIWVHLTGNRMQCTDCCGTKPQPTAYRQHLMLRQHTPARSRLCQSTWSRSTFHRIWSWALCSKPCWGHPCSSCTTSTILCRLLQLRVLAIDGGLGSECTFPVRSTLSRIRYVISAVYGSHVIAQFCTITCLRFAIGSVGLFIFQSEYQNRSVIQTAYPVPHVDNHAKDIDKERYKAWQDAWD